MPEELKLIAFFTTGITALDISVLSKKRRRKIVGNFPGRDSLNSIPVHLIGQIGRSDDYTKKELPGDVILEECYSRIKVSQMVSGGKLMILECREGLKQFYTKQGFNLLSEKNEKDLYTYYKNI